MYRCLQTNLRLLFYSTYSTCAFLKISMIVDTLRPLKMVQNGYTTFVQMYVIGIRRKEILAIKIKICSLFQHPDAKPTAP